MPRLTDSVPKYRKHRASGQAIVEIAGKAFYLGPHGTKASKAEYDRLIGEWLAAGRTLRTVACDTTVSELCAAYLRHAKLYYRKNGKPTRTIERVLLAMRPLKRVYAASLAADFGPLALQAVQAQFVRERKSRPYVNYLIEEIKRIFKWGVAQQIVPPAVHQGLSAVGGLKIGRSDAPEPKPILPVDDAAVDAVLPFLPVVVADMIRLQRATGMRPGELCIIRPRDVDRSAETWSYRPQSHKTEHHGRERVVFIGPVGQAILRPYLLRDADAYCFNPAESEAKRLEARHEGRMTPLGYGNAPGTNRVRCRKRPAGSSYPTGAYANCVRRACDLADRSAHEAQPEIAADERIVPRWHPNQLRHRLATEVRRRFGLEAAQVALGHSAANVTQIYAERDMALAARVAREVG